MLSLAPATTIDGLAASIATAGSFCLFCENGDNGLPTVTSVPGAGAAMAGTAMAAAPANTRDNDAPAAANLSVRIGPPSCVERAGLAGPLGLSCGTPGTLGPLQGSCAPSRREQCGPAQCLTYAPLCTYLNEKSFVAQCVTCGSELHPERAKKYDYCMAPECQEKNLKGLTMVAVGVNKSAEQYMLLDEDTKDELASGKYHDQRRGSFGTSLASPGTGRSPDAEPSQRTTPPAGTNPE